MSIIPGTLLIHDGTKIIPLDPSGEDGMALTFDSTVPGKLKWAPTGKSFKLNLLPNNSVQSTKYTTVTEFSLSEDEYKALSCVKIVSYMDQRSKSYNIRVYDSTHNDVLAEENYKNTTRQINKISNFEKNPRGDVIIEIQCKVNSDLEVIDKKEIMRGQIQNFGTVIIKDIDIFYV